MWQYTAIRAACGSNAGLASFIERDVRNVRSFRASPHIIAYVLVRGVTMYVRRLLLCISGLSAQFVVSGSDQVAPAPKIIINIILDDATIRTLDSIIIRNQPQNCETLL